MENLINIVKGLFTSNVTNGLADQLGEDEGHIHKGINAVIPSVLAGLLQRSSDTGFDLSGIVHGAQEITGGSNTDLTSILERTTGGNNDPSSWMAQGMHWLQSIFGDRTEDLTHTISSFSGLKSSSAATLIGTTLPFILSMIGRKSAHNTTQGLVSYLSSQKENIMSSIPSGFNLAGVLGLGSLSELYHKAAGDHAMPESEYRTPAPTQEYTEGKRGSGWIWLLLLALVGLALWYFLKDGCNKAEVPENPEPKVTDSAPAALEPVTAPTAIKGKLENGNWIYDVGAEKVITLADGSEMKVGENSTEARLFAFLSDAGAQVSEDKTRGWITLDRVYFETGKDVLTGSSVQQLKNIALILKNFPNAKAKFGGYTDNTGSDEVNVPLSDKRAKIAADQVVKEGADRSHIESEGYGAQHPVCPENSTDECKAQNRRVDIRVTAK